MKSDPKADARIDIEALISAAGGIDNLRERMGLDERRGYNVISTWRSRGAVPAAAQIEHRKLFLLLMRCATVAHRPGIQSHTFEQ